MSVEQQKLRIMQIIPSLAKGGAERLVVDICQELHQRPDIEVLLVNFHPVNTFEQQTGRLNRIVCPTRNKITGEFDTTALWEAMNSFRPHVIHSHLFEAEWASRHQVVDGIRYFSHLHDNMPAFNTLSVKDLLKSFKASLTRIYEKRMTVKRYRQCRNSFIAVSRDICGHFLSVLPSAFHSRIFLLPNAINVEKFNSALSKDRMKSAALRLVTVGSLVQKKNQSFLLPVVKTMIDKGMKVRLDIIGEGHERACIENTIRSLGLEDHVFLHGQVDEVEKFLEKADIYVHAATYEPFGLVFLEAMAAGLPCIALDGGGNRDLIRDDFNGYLVPGRNKDEFFEKIKLVSGSEELYKKLSRNAVEFASGYDIKPYVDRLLEIYRYS